MEQVPGVVRLKHDIEWQAVDDEVVALHLGESAYLAINDSGARLWPLVAAGTTEAALADELVATFNIDPALARTDARAFVARLRSSRWSTASLPRLVESRVTAVQRLEQLADEQDQRRDEPARSAGRAASAFPDPIVNALQRPGPARDHTPTVDPFQPSPAQRGMGGRPGPHLGR